MNISTTLKSIHSSNNMYVIRRLYMTNYGALRATQALSTFTPSSSNNKRYLHTTNYCNTIPKSAYPKPKDNIQKRSFSSEQKRDFYEVLGVPRTADKGTIKKAYFKLAKEYHPDRNKDDKQAADKFKEVTAAYEVLSDDKQRQLYDNFGHAGVDPNSGFSEGGNPFDGFPGFGGFNFNDGSFHVHTSGGPGGSEIDAEELFEAFFGGGGNRRRRNRGPKKGADLQMHVKLSFKEAVFGTSKDLHLRYQVRDSKNNKMVMKERDVTVDIPAGIDTGMNLRLAGKGAEGDPGAENGNLFVQVLVEDDPLFKRDGQDVHTEVPISFVQAVLGGTVDVETLTGTVEMKIPKGCQINTKLLLRNKGIPLVNSSHKKGNHIVHLQIQIPKKINQKQEQLLRQFDEESQICGLGLSGRIAKAAGSAFESIFGSSKKDEEKDEKDVKNEKDTNKDDKNDEDDVDEKKQQAQ